MSITADNLRTVASENAHELAICVNKAEITRLPLALGDHRRRAVDGAADYAALSLRLRPLRVRCATPQWRMTREKWGEMEMSVARARS